MGANFGYSAKKRSETRVFYGGKVVTSLEITLRNLLLFAVAFK